MRTQKKKQHPWLQNQCDSDRGENRRVFPCLPAHQTLGRHQNPPPKQTKRNPNDGNQKTSDQGTKRNEKENSTDLQASLRAVGLLSLPRRVLGTALSTNGLSLSTGHDCKKISRSEVASNRETAEEQQATKGANRLTAMGMWEDTRASWLFLLFLPVDGWKKSEMFEPFWSLKTGVELERR